MIPAQTLAVRKRIPDEQPFVLGPSLIGHCLSAGVGLAVGLRHVTSLRSGPGWLCHAHSPRKESGQSSADRVVHLI